MRMIRIAVHRFRSLFFRSHADEELRREFDVHIEQLTREYVAGGMAESEARLAARRDFGPLEVTIYLVMTVEAIAASERQNRENCQESAGHLSVLS